MCIFCVAAAADPSGATSAVTKPGFIVAHFVSPVLCTIPIVGLHVYSYGVLVAAALGFATMLFDKELRRARIDLDVFMCFFVFLFGFGVGSKGHLALSAFGHGEPLTWKAFDIRTGHSFIGSQIGAVGCMLIYICRKRVNVLHLLDVLLPCCLLGHCIGKAGCFFSGDGCYGPPADPRNVPWAMSFPNAMVPTRVPVHPTPIYEGSLSLLVMLMVRWLFPFPTAVDEDVTESPDELAALVFPKVGRRTALLLVLYGIERMLIEPFRRHPPIEFFGGLTEYQALAVGLFIAGVIIEMFVIVWPPADKFALPESPGKAKNKGGHKPKRA